MLLGARPLLNRSYMAPVATPDKRWCDFYKLPNHWTRDCRAMKTPTSKPVSKKRHLAQNGTSPPDQSDDWLANFLSNHKRILTLYNTVDPRLNGWYFDTETTHHTCKDRKLFKNFWECRIKVNSTTGITYATGYGDVDVITSLLWGNNVLRLRNVLYIPDLFVNLISSSTCQRDGITINTADCFLRTGDKTKLAHFFIQKELYRLNEPNNLHTTLSLIGSDHNSQRWHERLRHLNFADMRCLELPANPFDCKTCAISKRHKSFDRGPQQRAIAVGELVYIDVIYLTPVGIKGFKYAITFTDNYTRWMEVHFLKSKEARSV